MGTKRAIELTARIDATLATLMFLIGALEDEVGKIGLLEGADETVIPEVSTENGEDG